MGNPFTPTFGAAPPLLIGREDQLDLFQDALSEGPGSPGFATIYTGARGIGKTVMLNAAEDLARDAGYTVVSETATAGFLDRIVTAHLPNLLPRRRGSVRRIDTPVGGIEWDAAAPHTQALRSLVEQVTMVTPLLITLDELQVTSLPELRELCVVLQHAVREGRRLAFCGAGLPGALDALLKDRGVTFVRRADRHVLSTVALPAVAEAMRTVIEEAGRSIDPKTAASAAKATGGYPFLVQLIGYHAWRQQPEERPITLTDVRGGSKDARRRIGTLVFEPALADLSAVDRTFLLHMAADDGPSAMGEMASRLGADANYASQYRLRLIAAGLIESAGRGRVRFTMPYLREWLREHAAFDTVI